MRYRARLLRRAAVALTVAIGLAAGTVPAAAAAPTTLNYVNMGDSFSAASGVLPLAAGSDPRCTQSARNWAHVIARTHDYDLTDVSCGGAQTSDYTNSQFRGVAPQLEALSPETDLVTMTIGGNDSDLFITLIRSCGIAATTTLGRGNPCEEQYGDRFVDTINDVIYPNLVEALEKVQANAPNARVAIAGYLRILPSTEGCYPIMPVASGDVPYLNDIAAALNGAIERAAAATGATYIDVSAVSAGHDACKPIGTRWVEPALGSTNYVPIHPNARGERAMARRASAVLNLD